MATTASPPEQVRAPTPVRHAVGPNAVLAVAAGGVSLAFVDATMVNTAFPAIERSFSGTDLDALSWILTAYNIVFAALLLAGGRLADVLGRRRLFLIGVSIFTLASIGCAVSPSLGLLIAARMIQGAGAAIVVPSSLAIVLEAFPAERRATGVALWSATGAVSAGLGPVVGGLLIDGIGWRAAFLINVPIGLITIVLARRLLVESRAIGPRTTPDMGGALLLAATITLLALAIVNSDDWAVLLWSGCLLAAIGTGALFVRRARRHKSPIVDLALLRIRSVWLANVLTVLGATGLYAAGLCNVLFLTQVWDYDLVTVGLLAIPAPMVAALAARPAAALAMRIGAARTVAIGGLIWTCGIALLVTRVADDSEPYKVWLPATLVSGLGVGIAFPVISAAAVGAVKRAQFGVATAINAIARQLGAVLGVAALVAITGDLSTAQDVSSYRIGWLLAGGCFALTAVGALLLGRVPGMGAPPLLEAPPPAPRTFVRPERRSPPPDPVLADVVARSPAELLAGVPLFAQLSADDRQRLAAEAVPMGLEAGTVLFAAGDAAEDVYVVESGRIEMVDGDAPPILAGPGAALGDATVLAGAPRTGLARARRDSVLLRIPAADLERVLHDNPDSARRLSAALARELLHQRPTGAEFPLPSNTLLAVTAFDPSAPLDEVGAAFIETVRRYGTVAVLDDETGPDADIHYLDEVYDHVVLLARRDGPWRRKCLRDADRTIVVAGAGPPPPEAPPGCDLVFVDQPGAALGPWLEALNPRMHQVVAPDGVADGVAVAARRVTGRSVGIVLSSGGARGLAHIAVLEELLTAGITIDRVGGASMGALIGAMFASGMSPAEIDARIYDDWVRGKPANDYGLPKHSLIRGRRVRAVLQRTLPGSIEAFPRAFFCVAADLYTGDEIVMRAGPAWEAVGASMSLPGVAPPAVVNGRLLVDGAVVDALPVAWMSREEGPIIAVDTTTESQPAIEPLPGLLDTLQRVSVLTAKRSRQNALELASLIIRPPDMGVGVLEFHLIDVMRESGRRATLEALEQAPAVLFD